MIASLQLEMGSKTCAGESGKFCRMLRFVEPDIIPMCLLFDQKLVENNVVSGCLGRCDQCLDKFGGEHWPEKGGTP